MVDKSGDNRPEAAESKPPKRARRRGSKVLGWFLGIFLFLSLLVGGFQLAFYFYADQIVGTVLKSVVSLRSDGLYELDYSEIKVDAVQRKLRFRNLTLQINRKKFEALKRAGAISADLNEITVPEFEMAERSLTSFVFTRKLALKNIKVRDPEVVILHLDSNREAKRFRAFDLYGIIDGYLHYITVDNFQLLNGSLVFRDLTKEEPSEVALHHVNAYAGGVRIDSTVFPRQGLPLHADSFELNIRGNRFDIEGMPYIFAFDRLRILPGEKEVQLNGFRTFTREGVANRLDFRLPILRVEGVDLVQAYRDKELSIDRIKIQTGYGNVKLSGKGEVNENWQEEASASIERFLSPLFHYTFIREIDCNEAKLDLKIWQAGKWQRIQLPKFRLLASQVMVDSAALKRRGRQFFAEDIEFEVQRFNIPVRDSAHLLSMGELKVSTSKSNFRAKDFRIRSTKGSKARDRYDLRIPRLEASGVDIWSMYLDRTLAVDRLQLDGPDLMLRSTADSLRKSTKIDLWDLYPLIQGDLRSLAINDFKIRNGHLDLTRQRNERSSLFDLEGITIGLQNFVLDSNSASSDSKLFYSDAFSAKASDFSFLMPDSTHVMEVQNVVGSSSSKTFIADQVAIRPLAPIGDSVWGKGPDVPVVVDLSFHHLDLSGIDYRKAYYELDYEVDALRVAHPVGRIYRNPQYKRDHPGMLARRSKRKKARARLLNDYLQGAQVRTVQFDSVGVELFDSLQAEKPRVEVRNLFLCSENSALDSTAMQTGDLIFRSEDLDFYGQEMILNLPDKHHRIRMKHFSGSEIDQTFYAHRFRLEPEAKYKNLGKQNVFDFKVPELRMNGLGLQAAMFDRVLRLDSITSAPPVVEALLFQKEQKEASGEVLSNALLDSPLNKVFEEVLLKHLKFEEAEVNLISDVDGKPGRLYSPRTAVQVDSFRWKKDLESLDFLYSKNVQFEVKDLDQVMPDSLYRLNAKRLAYSSRSRALDVDSLHYRPQIGLEEQILKQQEKRPLQDVMIPNMQLAGLVLPDLLTNRKLLADRISLTAPVVRLYRPIEPGVKPQRPDPAKWPAALQSVFETIQVDEFRLINGSFDPIADAGVEPGPCLYNLSMQLDSLHVDTSRRHNRENLLYTRKADWSITDYSFPVGDGRFTLGWDRADFSAFGQRATLSNLSLKPYTDKLSFAPPFGYETDWVNLSKANVELQGLDYFRFLSEGRLQVEKTYVQNLDLHVFRDKRLPFPESQHPRTPQQIIMNLGVPIKFDSVLVQNANIMYQEYADEGLEEGTIRFDKLNAEVENVTNNRALLETGLRTRVEMNALIMGAGLMTGKFDFDLDDPDGNFVYEGTVHPMEITEVNPMLENVAFVRIKRGKVKRLDMTVAANDQYATGRMLFRYNNLAVSFLNKETKQITIKEKLGAFIANAFVVQSNNPKFLFPRKGIIYYERDSTRSIFNYLARTTFNGLQNSVGSGLVKTNARKMQRIRYRQVRKAFKEQKRLAKQQYKTEEKARKRAPVQSIDDQPEEPVPSGFEMGPAEGVIPP